MLTKKPETAVGALSGSPAKATDATTRRVWKKKTPVEVVIEQIDKLKREVEDQEQELRAKRQQLQKMEEARKIFESA